MTSKKTLRALLSSILSLVLCCSMLIGTTFAWFTDSVTSTNNIITAGNLDIELYYQNDETSDWTKVDATSNVFKLNTLWEPGHTEVVKLKVVNEGTLALKYQLGVNVASETGSFNMAGEPLKLSDHIQFAIIDGEQNYTRAQAVAAAEGKSTALKQAYSSDTIALYPAAEAAADDTKAFEAVVTMVVYMPTSVGNEANYGKGKNAPQINLGLNLLATQFTYENDSFGPDYDVDADETLFAATLSDLRDILAEGGKVALSDSVIFTDEDEPFNAFPGYSQAYPAVAQITKDTDLYLNGNDFAYAGTGTMYYLLSITDGATVNIYGNSDSVLSSTDPEGTNAIAANRKSVVNIYGGTYTSKDVSVVDLNSGAVVNIYDGFFYAEKYTGNGTQTNVLLNTTNSDPTATFHTYGGTYVNFDPRTAQDGNYVPAGYTVITKTQENGEIWYTVVPAELETYEPVYSVEDIAQAVQGGGDILIATDIVSNEAENLFDAGEGNAINVNGNGNTITTNGVGAETGEYGYVGFIPGKGEDAVVSDVKVAGSGFVEVGHYGVGGGNYTVNNMVIENLEATLCVANGSDLVSAAFAHYGTAVLNNCVMTGTTTVSAEHTAYDAGFVNGTTTTINGGEYGSMYVWSQAHVTINGAEVGKIVSSAITTKNYGMLTIGAGTTVDTIEITCADKYTPALTIEDGATVGTIIYKGVPYTQAEWLAR